MANINNKYWKVNFSGIGIKTKFNNCPKNAQNTLAVTIRRRFVKELYVTQLTVSSHEFNTKQFNHGCAIELTVQSFPTQSVHFNIYGSQLPFTLVLIHLGFMKIAEQRYWWKSALIFTSLLAAIPASLEEMLPDTRWYTFYVNQGATQKVEHDYCDFLQQTRKRLKMRTAQTLRCTLLSGLVRNFHFLKENVSRVTVK